MSFTDDDLKELKNGMSTLRMAMDVSEYSLGTDELEALLARLEMAEKANEAWVELAVERSHAVRSIEGEFEARQKVAIAVEAWRKAAGKCS